MVVVQNAAESPEAACQRVCEFGHPLWTSDGLDMLHLRSFFRQSYISACLPGVQGYYQWVLEVRARQAANMA